MLGNGLGDVECLVCTLDLQLRSNDGDAQEQSYGFGFGMTTFDCAIGRHRPGQTRPQKWAQYCHHEIARYYFRAFI